MMKTMFFLVYLYMVFIYGLIDPFTFKVRYIGKTIKLKQRLQNQCNEKANTYRSNWIQSIIKQHKRPIQVVLQELNDDEDWQHAEIKWIAIARKYGWDLVNGTDGGDGVVNLSPESRKRISDANKNQSFPPERLKKMSEVATGVIKTESCKDILSQKMKGRKIEWKDKLVEANRKLTDEDIEKIQIEFSKGALVKDLSAKYGIHRTTMTKVKMGTYKVFKQKTVNYIKPRRFHSL